MKKTLSAIAALMLLASTPTWAGSIPKELLGEWCFAEQPNDATQIYSRAPSINCSRNTKKLQIISVGLFMRNDGEKRGVICVAPRDFEAGAKIGVHFKADCGFDDNSSPVQTVNFYMYPMLKKSLGVVLDF